MRSILIVDDDNVTLGSLSRLLRGHFRVLAVEGLHAALDLLEREQPVDVLLTDLEIGPDSGLWLLRQARENFPETRRLLTSGREPGGLDEYRRAGLVEHFFPKPLQVREVVRAPWEARRTDRHPRSSGDSIVSRSRHGQGELR
jgi:two-component system cell cycle sensor histidine kinase/response regulator CckA